MNKILVIDDDPDILLMYQMMLKIAGYECETANSGKSGIIKAKESNPCIILLDLNMPGISGVETLLEIRKFNPMVNICIVSAFVDSYKEELEQMKNEGIKFSLQDKPLDIKLLLELVKNCKKT